MNTKVTNKVKMFRTVKTLCASYEAVWDTVPPFVTAYIHFTGKLTELEQLVTAQSNSLIGKRVIKDEEREATAQRAHQIASALRALAADTGDSALREQLHFSLSDLQYNGSEQVLQLIGRVRDAAMIYAAPLIDYQITQTMIDELNDHVNLLTAAFGSTRNAIVNRSLQTSLIKETIHEIDAILKTSMDQLVVVLKPNHHEFFLAYQKARELVETHGKKNKDGKDGTPDPS